MKGGTFMHKGLKRFLGIFLSAVMVICSMPVTIFAANDGATLTIYSNVTANGVEIDDSVSLDYQVAIDGELYNGVAKGDDGKDYSVVNGKLTVPYNVKAVISEGLNDGSEYVVKRLAYDNQKYALVGESSTVTGTIASRIYYKSVNGGESVQISAEDFNAETHNGENLSRSYYVNVNDETDEYEKAETKNFFAYEEGLLNSYSAKENTYTYAAGTDEKYELSLNGAGFDEIKEKVSGFGSFKVTTYTVGNVWATVSTNYADDISYSETDKPTLTTHTSMGNSRSAIDNVFKNIETKGIYTVLSSIAERSGKTAVVDAEIPTSTSLDTADKTANVCIFTQVTPMTAEYTVDTNGSHREAAFDVTLEKAPTGTVCLDFILDNTVPEAFDGAEFEIHRITRDAEGKQVDTLLADGTDYNLTVENKDVDLKVAKIGFTRYTFSDIASGEYYLQQIKGAASYAIDATKYFFSVARTDGSVTGDYVKSAASLLGDPSSVISNDVKDYKLVKLNVFANKSFSFKFNTKDQNGDPVEGSQYFMIERDGTIALLRKFIEYGVGTATGMDWGALLDAITSGGELKFDAQTIVNIIVTLASLSPEQLGEVTLPAILMEKSDANGVTEFDNNSNILNALGLLSGLGDVKTSDLVNLVKTLLGGSLSEDVLKALDGLAAIDVSIKVHSGVPTGAYLFFESSAPNGYERNSAMYTVNVNSDGTAVATSGVLLPLIADYIDDRLGFDIYSILVSEDEFNNASQQVKNLFGTFDNYMNTVVDRITDFVDNNLGGVVDTSRVKELQGTINKYYDQYDDLSKAVSDGLRDFNKSIQDDFTSDWTYTVQRYFVEIKLIKADCANNDLADVSLTVTDAEGNVYEIEEDGNVTVPYGVYTVTADAPEQYILFDAVDEEGNPAYTNPVTVTVDDHTAEYIAYFNYHTKGEWTTVTDKTCVVDGLENLSCAKCGVVLESKTDAAEGHKYDEVTVDATCLAVGYTMKTCLVCGDVQVENEVPALGHDYQSVVTAPTHENAGYTTHICSRCGDSYVDTFTDPEGHELVVKERQEPKCEEDGYILYGCADDDGYEERITLTALGHLEVIDPAKAPTCTETGLTKGSHCSRCGKVFTKQEEIKANGHHYNAVVTNPTCTEQGYTTYTCTVCQDTKVENYTDPHGHAWKTTLIKAPDCEHDGYTDSVCIYCGETQHKVDEGSKLGHDYVSRVVEPTCEFEGYTENICKRGDSYTRTDYVDKWGHDLVTDAAVEPTCTKVGYTEGSHCSRCLRIAGVPGAKAQEEIPALGHITVVDERVEPTCTTSGLMLGSHCSRCGEILVAQEVIPELGHSMTAWSIDSFPRDGIDGLMTRQCERCDYSEERVIPAFKVHKVDGNCKCEGDCCDGNCICLCDMPIKLAKIIYKLHRVFSVLLVLFGVELPPLCNHWSVL